MFWSSEARVNFHWTGHIHNQLYNYIYTFFDGNVKLTDTNVMFPAWIFSHHSTAPLGVTARGESGSCEWAPNIIHLHSNRDLISFDPPKHFAHTYKLLSNIEHTHFSERLPRLLNASKCMWNPCQNMLQHQVFCFFPMYHCVDSAHRWTHLEIQLSKLPEKLHDAQDFI